MAILCDKCAHKMVCAHANDFKFIINKIDTLSIYHVSRNETEHISDFKWFSYNPHCKYFLNQIEPLAR